MKRFVKVVSSTLCVAVVLSSGLFVKSPVVNAAGVAINSVNFPDENFRNYISEECDKNQDNILSTSELDAITELNLSRKEIVSLTGLGHFTSLEILYCGDNNLKSLDISMNTKLKDLYCSYNQLTSLDISKNTALDTVFCENNQLTSLDVSKNVALETLDCSENQLTSLIFGNNTALDTVYCANNKLSSLDVSKCISLSTLWCYANELTVLDVSKNVNLKSLEFQFNQLTSIDVSKNTVLKLLYCVDNKLTSLDVSKNTKLEQLYCDDNQLKELDTSKNAALKNLSCDGNLLTSIDVSKNVKLESLSCSYNQLTNLDISKNTLLRYLEFSNNQLTSIDVSNNSELTEFDGYDNQLTSLDFSKNVKLRTLLCSYNQLVSLNISNSTLLKSLACLANQLNYIDISNCPMLIDCYTNGTKEDLLSRYYRYEHKGSDGNSQLLDLDITTTIYTDSSKVPSPTPTTQPTPTSVPTVGPIPTAAPTTEASKSVGSFVDRCYSVALGREADEGGYNYWLDALNNGEICGAQAGYGFIFSGEYANKNATNDEFVTDLYSMYFGRTPDEGGFNYWVGLLNNGASREEIFAGFANSTEFDNLCSDYGVVTGAYIVGVPNDQQGGVNAFVARLYNICLTRRPDQAGQAGWSQKLIAGEVTGTTCAYGFVFSPEFIGKQPSNEEFVAYMYRAFFGREADEAGFTAWVQQLYSGASYEDVFSGFSGSAEFANLCASYGISA